MMAFQVPTPQSQDKAIASVIHHLHQSRDWREGPTDCQRAIYSLMLKYGRTWYIGTRTFAGRRAARKQCYMNAYTLTAKDPHMVYVEGWCMAGGYPFGHAWCIDRDGQVVDPTLREAAGYFGIPLRWRYVQDAALKNRVYGVFPNSDLRTVAVEAFLHDIAR